MNANLEIQSPPHSIASEQAVLGALMLDNDALPKVAEILNSADFYRADHRLIFRTIEALHEAAKPFDAVVLSEIIAASEAVEEAPGLTYMAEITRDTPTAANVLSYAEAVAEKARRRRLLAMSSELVEAVTHSDQDSAEIASRISARMEIMAKPSANRKTIETLTLAEIKPQRINWLWYGRIPCGKVTLFVGDPGLAKSLMLIGIGAAVTRGAPWPCGEGLALQGDVLLASAEDDDADTIRPRAEAAGADLTRFHVMKFVKDRDSTGKPIKRGWTMGDVEALESKLRALPNCKLVIIDPISAFLSGTDSHKNSDIRELLSPLAELAGRHGVAVVCISHLNKSQGAAIYRTSGSLAFVAAARAVYVVAKDKESPSRRLVLPIKANLGPDATGLAYSIAVVDSDVGFQPVIEWEADVVRTTADEALRAPTVDDGAESEGSTALDSAIDFLKKELADGAVSQKQIKADADQAGCSWATVRRAKDALGVKPEKLSFDGGWNWRLPDKDDEANMLKDAQCSRALSSEHLRKNEHLRANPQDAQKPLDAHTHTHKGREHLRDEHLRDDLPAPSEAELAREAKEAASSDPDTEQF